MASHFSKGAAHAFIGFGTTVLYLGTAQRPPKHRIRRGFVPVYNDISGTQVPFDLLYSSQEAFTIFDLNRFNRSVLNRIQSMPNTLGASGINTAADIGTLMLTEGFAFTLIIAYPFATSHPAMAAAGLPRGIVFPGTVLEGPDDIDDGTTAEKINLIFHSIPMYVPSTGAFVLAHANVPALPAIN